MKITREGISDMDMRNIVIIDFSFKPVNSVFINMSWEVQFLYNFEQVVLICKLKNSASCL